MIFNKKVQVENDFNNKNIKKYRYLEPKAPFSLVSQDEKQKGICYDYKYYKIWRLVFFWNLPWTVEGKGSYIEKMKEASKQRQGGKGQ